MQKISVIVPVYKVEPYLRRCVDSILAQTFTDFELILVDDNSPDNCGVICDEYAQKDSRVRVIHQENQGQAAARNRAVNATTADWLCFVDADDVVHPRYLELLVQAVKRSGAKISFCETVRDVNLSNSFFEDQFVSYEGINTDEQGLLELWYSKDYCYGVVWGKLIDKELYQQNPLTVGRIYEDSAIVYKWLWQAQRIEKVKAPLYFYFVNSYGTAGSSFSIKQLDILWSKEEQEKFYREIGYTHMLSVVISSYLMSAARCYRQTLDELKDKATAKDIRKRIIKKYLKNRSMIQLKREDRLYILKMLHPNLMELYWIAAAQQKKLFKR